MKHKFLVFAFVAQFALIALVFFNAYLPILFGDEVKLRARGYDPRDILSGNFVRLDYDIRVKEGEFNATQNRKNFLSYLSMKMRTGCLNLAQNPLMRQKMGFILRQNALMFGLMNFKSGRRNTLRPKKRHSKSNANCKICPAAQEMRMENLAHSLRLKFTRAKLGL